MFSIAAKNLFHEKTRFIISVSGITFALILILMLEGFSGGLYAQLSAFARNSGSDIFILQKGVDNSLFVGSVLPTAVEKKVKSIKGVKKSSGILYIPVVMVKGSNKTPIQIVGYRLKNGLGAPWLLSAGRRPRADRQELVMDLALAQRNKVDLNDRIKILGKKFKVVGFSRETSSWMLPLVFMSRRNLAKLMAMPNLSSLVLVQAEKGVNLSKLSHNIKLAVPLSNPIPTANLIKKEAKLLKEMMSSMLNLLISVAYIIGALVIGLTVYTAVIEKLREYGILKALGADKRHLYSIVIIQSLINVGLGFIVSALSVNIFFKIIETLFPRFLLVINAEVLGRTFLLAIVMALIAAIIPIRRLGKIDAAEVFNG